MPLCLLAFQPTGSEEPGGGGTPGHSTQPSRDMHQGPQPAPPRPCASSGDALDRILAHLLETTLGQPRAEGCLTNPAQVPSHSGWVACHGLHPYPDRAPAHSPGMTGGLAQQQTIKHNRCPVHYRPHAGTARGPVPTACPNLMSAVMSSGPSPGGKAMRSPRGQAFNWLCP